MYNILLHRLENWVGLCGMVIKWLKSLLEDWDFFVAIGDYTSWRTPLTCGVPLGSILGPMLFNLYLLPLGQILIEEIICYHSYADDTQMYPALSPYDYGTLESLCQSIGQIKSWMTQHFLQLNKDKTEIILINNLVVKRRGSELLLI